MTDEKNITPQPSEDGREVVSWYVPREPGAEVVRCFVQPQPLPRSVQPQQAAEPDRKSTRLNSSHLKLSRMPSSA